MDIAIWPEFKNRLRPLSKYERERLEENLIADGCREPLVVWCKDGESVECGTLLDGHNRLEICSRLGIHYEIVEANGIQSEADALRWINGNQAGRRNEPAFVRFEGVVENKAEIQEKARANQVASGGDVRSKTVSQNSDEPIRTDEILAEMAGMSRDTFRKAERLREEAEPELLDALRRKEVSIHLASQVVDLPDEQRTQAIAEALLDPAHAPQVLREAVRAHVANNSGNNEWYTPANIITAAREAMGSIDIDPASSDIANQTVQAATYFTAETNGLAQEWPGNVWMNPPYAQPLIADFSAALAEKVKVGEVRQACVLVNNGTETAWFQTLLDVASAVCLVKTRVKFVDPNGKPSAPLQGQAVIYIGKESQRFADAFCSFGKVLYG